MPYCRNCGKEIAGISEYCPGCGARPLAGNAYCQNCAAPVTPLTEICPKCGVRITQARPANASPKSRLVVTLLSILPALIGVNGVHRFYLGKIGTGLLMLFTFGGLGVWTLIDFIMAVSGAMKDKDGKLITFWE
jgi:TM2 domain-containing membrane protein YozV/RNA polymerase subunit RPABC4/transcription elongation factor Spt4